MLPNKLTRRQLLRTASATIAATCLPTFAHGKTASGHTHKSANGEVTIHPVSHASFVMRTPAGVIYADPVGDTARYKDLPPADLILITHHHGDHFAPRTLGALASDKAKLIANPKVHGELSADLAANATKLANGDSQDVASIRIDAIPAYNLTEARKKYHPKGRDNGYVLTIDGMRIYIAGDTEDIPEMRALKDIDIAFVPMNLPYTMDVKAAASAVKAFAPKVVYPYHYKGQDPAEFAKLVGDASQVNRGDWY